jgi:hypothetical protein
MTSRPVRSAVLSAVVLLAASTMAVGQRAPLAAQGGPNDDSPMPIIRGGRVSGVARRPAKPPSRGGGGGATQCATPGDGGNYKTNCHGTGRPVNEPWIAGNGSMLVSGANDYNSYNGQGQDGFYWSWPNPNSKLPSCGRSWYDAGPIDVFPHTRPAQYDAAGDPGLAFDPVDSTVVYYSSLFFNFTKCNVGGVELLRGTFNSTQNSWTWNFYQIAANSSSSFQDKPAVTADKVNSSTSNVYVSWTQFGSCSGSNVPSPIMVAVLPGGGSSTAPTKIMSVPGSQYSQGSSIAADGSGNGFWIAWEEYPSASATTGLGILLSHCTWTGSDCTWTGPTLITNHTFQDLASPLPGFSFRTDSFPALTVVAGIPYVTWTAYNASSSAGRAYLWSGTSSPQLQELTPDLDTTAGNDQFFPAIAPNPGASPPVFVSFSQVDTSAGTYDAYLWDRTAPHEEIMLSSKSSVPSEDGFFSGQFIGDYTGMAVLSQSQNSDCGTGTEAHPIWTDIHGPDPNYTGWEMDGMVWSQ